MSIAALASASRSLRDEPARARTASVCSVADAYLYTVLNWSMATPVDLAPWPAVQSYFKRLQTRPSIARAFKEELALYKAEQTRHQAA